MSTYTWPIAALIFSGVFQVISIMYLFYLVLGPSCDSSRTKKDTSEKTKFIETFTVTFLASFAALSWDSSQRSGHWPDAPVEEAVFIAEEAWKGVLKRRTKRVK